MIASPHPLPVNSNDGDVVFRMAVGEGPWVADLGVDCPIALDFDPRTTLLPVRRRGGSP